MTNEQTIQQNLVLLEYYKEQLNSLDMQLQISQAAINDYTKAKITLEHLKTSEKNDELLIPLGGGTFIRTTLQDQKTILTDIGAGIVTEKPIPEALKKVDERIAIMSENREKLVQLAEKLQKEATTLSQKTQDMMDQSKK